MNFAKIGDRKVLGELPLKLFNLTNRITDYTEVVNMGENGGEVGLV